MRLRHLPAALWLAACAAGGGGGDEVKADAASPATDTGGPDASVDTGIGPSDALRPPPTSDASGPPTADARALDARAQNDAHAPEDGLHPGDAAADAAPPPPADASAPPPPPGAFWRLERTENRTWLVSPEGRRTFLLGVNTVMRDVRCDGILGWIRRLPPTQSAHREWARLASGSSGGEVVENPYCFNSIGGFSDTNDFDDTGGDSYLIRPPEAGGVGAPYGVVIYLRPRGEDRALKDERGTALQGGYSEARLGDPFNPAYLGDLRQVAEAEVAPRRDDPRLQMWFADNETGLFDRTDRDTPGVRDLRRWLWSDCPAGSSPEAPACTPHALAAFLSARYGGDVAALNAAWETAHADFASLVQGPARPVPYVHDCNLTCREDLQRFVHDRLLPAWVDAVTLAIRRADPNHLVATPRLALASADSYRFWTPANEAAPDVWADSPEHEVGTDREDVHYRPWRQLGRRGEAGFDLVAVNVYSGDREYEEPWFSNGLNRVFAESGLPVVVSEFSVRARIDGWSNRGGAGAFVPSNDGTDDQIQRGAYYRSKIEQFIRLRHVVGASWHAWADRYEAADPGHQINMGLVQCDDPARGFTAGTRWDEIDDRMAEINCAIEDRIDALTGP